jgi:hypothetical protein
MVMQISFIAPKSLAKYTTAGDFHFVIPQNASDFYETSRNFKMLDNGAYEGGAINFYELIKIAEKLNVDEVVIPDVIRDAKRTMWNVYKYAKEVPDRFSIAAVPQGKTISEFLECFYEMSKLPNLCTICFPKWLGKSRPAVIHYLQANNRLSYMFDYHLMGLDDPTELFCYKGMDIRSVDTSMPFTYAYHYKKIRLFEQLELSRVPMNLKVPAFGKTRLKYLQANFEVLRDVVERI